MVECKWKTMIRLRAFHLTVLLLRTTKKNCKCSWLNYMSSTYQFKFLLCASCIDCVPTRSRLRVHVDCLAAIKLLWISHQLAMGSVRLHTRKLRSALTHTHTHGSRPCMTSHRVAGNMFGRKKAPLPPALVRCIYIWCVWYTWAHSMTWQRTCQLRFEAHETKYPSELFMLKQISMPVCPFQSSYWTRNFFFSVHSFTCHSSEQFLQRNFTVWQQLLLCRICWRVCVCVLDFRYPHIRSNDVMVWK